MSELALIKEKTLSDIGDAIREKTETTEKLKPKEMPAKIKSIQTGVSIDDLLGKGYNLTIDKDSFTNQYPVYNIYAASGTNGEVSGVDIPNKYLGNGFFSIDVKLKPKEGYKIGTMKIESSTPDESTSEYHEYVLSDINITQKSAAIKATEIDGQQYMLRWYPEDVRNTLTELTPVTKAIMADSTCHVFNNMQNMFSDCPKLKELSGLRLNTSDISNMEAFCRRDESLEKINLSGINLAKIQDMRSAFADCRKLKSIIFPESTFKKSGELKNLYLCFQDCENLEVIDLRGVKLIPSVSLLDFIKGDNKLKYIILNKESEDIVTEDYFVENLKLAGVSDSLTVIIEGLTVAKLSLLESQMDTSKWTQAKAKIDSSTQYTITDNGDGTIEVQKNESGSTEEWKTLSLATDIGYAFTYIPGINNKKIRLRVTGTSNNHTFTNLEIPVVFKVNDNYSVVFAVTTGKMSSLRQFFDAYLNFQNKFPGLFAQLNSNSYDNDCMFMILDEDSVNYSIHTITSNNVTQCGRCRNGSEVLMPNIRYLHYFTEFNITKLEYKVIEDADIEPTDYKLNFD